MTFDHVTKLKNDLDEKLVMSVDDKPVPVILLANKVREQIYMDSYTHTKTISAICKRQKIQPRLISSVRNKAFLAGTKSPTLSSWTSFNFNLVDYRLDTLARDDINLNKALHILVGNILARLEAAERAEVKIEREQVIESPKECETPKGGSCSVS